MLKKGDIVCRLAEKCGMTKTDAEKAVNAMVDIFEDACVNDGGIQIVGVVTIAPKLRKGRNCKNPATGESMQTEDSYALSIKTGKSLKEKLN